MQTEFWLERWERGEIGFHLDDINPYLRQYWPQMQLPAGSRVLVPLCGKSLDLMWLRDQGYRVVGVELSRLAVEAFFREAGLVPQVSPNGALQRYAAGDIEIFCGDFFALTPDEVPELGAVYDRAALIALPLALRSRYVRHLAGLMGNTARGLLISMDYPQAQMPGPPFAVEEAEVQRLYTGFAEVRSLALFDVLAQNERFRQRGLTRMQEQVFQLEFRPEAARL
jgi:thiopurine S-methyltransferase